MHLFLREEVVDREVRLKNSTRKVGVATVEIATVLSQVKREKHEKNKREFVDRGVGSLLDGYCTTEDLEAIPRYYISTLSARNLELPDLFSVMLEHKGFTDCRALVMIMQQGKPNQYERRDFGSCIRHWNVEISLSARSNNIKVLKGGKLTTKAMTCRAHYDATVKAFSALGLHSKGKTHAARGSGSRMAELAGANE
ncbi:hypothetical protein PHMEG_00014113 [Phytophthora megakarya]|uniref:Ndc10 domain-containing protein n=1 Tax=Phytophthora megakarya TaxID=4795 RepID=A0A225W5P9_9STRA|nr:hypothetical protein PHMEG_00014113 [Phytophthora megakarya]